MDVINGTSLSRPNIKDHPAKLVLYPGRSPQISGWASFQGIKTHCAGYAVDNMEQIIWLYAGGPQQAVRSLWAALAGGGALEIDQTVVRYERETSYLRLEAPMAMTRFYSMALLHPQASLLRMQPEKDCFYLLSDSADTTPLALFYKMLNKALSLPLAPEWADYLWKAGTQMLLTDHNKKGEDAFTAPRERLITALKTKACGGWRVLTDMAYWMLVIEFGLKNEMIQ